MHLLHFSANSVGNHPESAAPGSSYRFPSNLNQTQDHLTPDVHSSMLTQSVSPNGSSEDTMAANNSLYGEDAQLPTPATSLDQSNPNSFQPYPNGDVGQAGHDHTKPPFSDFLRDLLYHQPVGGNSTRLADAQGLPVLDFYDNANLDFKEFDFSSLDHLHLDAARGVADQAACSVDMTMMRSALVKIWTDSPWRWNPQKTDSAYTEQSGLPLLSHDPYGAQIHEDRAAVDRVFKETLHNSCRDQILAIVLGTCRDSNMANRVTSSFPSADSMDAWINIFLAAHLCQTSSWIHYGSFSLNGQCPEWLAIAAAAGAVLTPVPPLRRFGFALQETVREYFPSPYLCFLALRLTSFCHRRRYPREGKCYSLH